MENFLMMDLVIKLFYALITLGFVWGVARLSDKQIGINFKEEFSKVKEDEKALGIYFGFRLVAISIIISSFF